MPDVYLDKKILDIDDTEGDSTIARLLEAVEKELQVLRRCIFELSIDGESKLDWRVPEVLERPLSSIGELRLVTASVEDIALQGLDTVQEYVKVIKENMDAAVEGLRRGSGRTEDHVNAVFEGVSEVVKTMDALAKNGARYGIELFRENPSAYYEPLLLHLEAVSNARSSADSVLLSDILEYELRPTLEEMEDKLFCSEET